MNDERVGIAVFAPSPVVTVTLEADAQGGTEVHFHAGSQGVWIARMIQRLGAPRPCAPRSAARAEPCFAR